jgi:hypothetical protein
MRFIPIIVLPPLRRRTPTERRAANERWRQLGLRHGAVIDPIRFCNACGKPGQTSDAFCRHCGVRLCWACGQPGRTDDVFCQHCGVAVQS